MEVKDAINRLLNNDSEIVNLVKGQFTKWDNQVKEKLEKLSYKKLLIDAKSLYLNQSSGFNIVSQNGEAVYTNEFDLEIPENATYIEIFTQGFYTRDKKNGHQSILINFDGDDDTFYIGDTPSNNNPFMVSSYWGIPASIRGKTVKVKIGVRGEASEGSDRAWITGIYTKLYRS